MFPGRRKLREAILLWSQKETTWQDLLEMQSKQREILYQSDEAKKIGEKNKNTISTAMQKRPKNNLAVRDPWTGMLLVLVHLWPWWSSVWSLLEPASND